MSSPNNHRKKGQALVEYLLIFGLMALISVGMAKALNGMMNNMVTSLSYVLSQHLSVGVCESSCFFYGYKNQ